MSDKSHILVIDDEKNYLLVLQTLLEDEGYTVTAISDPETALAFLAESEVDVVVTEQGIAVNPRRPDLKEKIEAAGLHVFTIEQLQRRAEALVGVPEPIRYKDRIVGVVMYRDNTIIDVVREIVDDA